MTNYSAISILFLVGFICGILISGLAYCVCVGTLYPHDPYISDQIDAMSDIPIIGKANDTLQITIPEIMPSGEYYVYTAIDSKLTDMVYTIHCGDTLEIPENGVNTVYVTWMGVEEIKYSNKMYAMKYKFQYNKRNTMTSTGYTILVIS